MGPRSWTSCLDVEAVRWRQGSGAVSITCVPTCVVASRCDLSRELDFAAATLVETDRLSHAVQGGVTRIEGAPEFHLWSRGTRTSTESQARFLFCFPAVGRVSENTRSKSSVRLPDVRQSRKVGVLAYAATLAHAASEFVLLVRSAFITDRMRSKSSIHLPSIRQNHKVGVPAHAATLAYAASEFAMLFGRAFITERTRSKSNTDFPNVHHRRKERVRVRAYAAGGLVLLFRSMALANIDLKVGAMWKPRWLLAIEVEMRLSFGDTTSTIPNDTQWT